MSEMVELVARAIWEKRRGALIVTGTSPDINRTFEEARAAIEAMRQPTESMESAGALVFDDDLCDATNAMNMWQEMIDEALK